MDMNSKIIKNTKNELEIHFPKLDQGLFNLIKTELWKIKETKLAGFRITHPEVGEIEFFLKTQGKDAKKVWNEAITSLIKKISDFEKTIEKIK